MTVIAGALGGIYPAEIADAMEGLPPERRIPLCKGWKQKRGAMRVTATILDVLVRGTGKGLCGDRPLL